jgi:hypothetical protein
MAVPSGFPLYTCVAGGVLLSGDVGGIAAQNRIGEKFREVVGRLRGGEGAVIR